MGQIFSLPAVQLQPQVRDLDPGDAHLLQLGADGGELVPDLMVLHGAPDGGAQASAQFRSGVTQLILHRPLQLVTALNKQAKYYSS